MTLPSFGVPLSINDIHIEAGGSSGTTASLNDADIRGLIGKASGAQNSILEYYGASAASEIKFELDGGGGGSASTNSGGVGGRTTYIVDASPGTQFDVWVGDRGNDGNTALGGGGGAGSVVRHNSSGTYLCIAGGAGGGGYFGGNGGNGGGGGTNAGVSGAPTYAAGGGDGGSNGVGGDESSPPARYLATDGEDFNGSTLFGTGGLGGSQTPGGGGLAGGNGNGVCNGGQGGNGTSTGDSGGGGGGGGYGGGAGGCILNTAGQGAGGGGGGGLALSSGLPSGLSFVSVSGSTGGAIGTNGVASIKVYVNNVLQNTYSQGTSNTFTVP